jgi:hypothetical protein
MGGLAEQGAPVPPNSPAKVTYPFKSLDGSTTVDRLTTGERTFDYPSQGVANYGEYADWTDEVRNLGGPQIVGDLLRGPEAYLQMWERSVGIPATKCLGPRAKLGARGLGPIRLGMSNLKLLRRAGQPLQRTRAWTYCVKGSRREGAAAVLTPEGKVALVATRAPSHGLVGIRPGDRLADLRGHARRIGGGVWTKRLGKSRVAYLVRHGRVQIVAVASRQAGSGKKLRGYLKLVPKHGMKARPAFAARSAASAINARNAVPLVQQQDPHRYAFFCEIGL